MRSEWLAVSAAALVVGASALFFGSHLVPRPTGSGEVLELTTQTPELWMAASLLLAVASFGLLMGISALGPLLRGRGFGLGVLGMVLIAIAAVMMFGFAQQLILLRALRLEAGVSDELLSTALQEPVQRGMLLATFACFYLGEVCLGIALLMARATPRWVSWALIGHVVLVLLTFRLEASTVNSLPSLLMVAGFLGAAISANRVAFSPVIVRGPARGATGSRD